MGEFFLKTRVGMLIVFDIAFFYLALGLMFYLRFGSDFASGTWEAHLFAFSLLFPLWLISFYIFGLYDQNFAKNSPLFYFAILKAATLNGFISTTIFYLFPNFFGVTPKTNLFLVLLFSGLLLSLWRYFYNLIVKSTGFARKIIIIGKNPQTKELAEKINSNPQIGYKVISSIDPEKDKLNFDQGVHTVVAASNLANYPDLAKELYRHLPHCNFENFSDFYEKITGKVPLFQIDEFWFLNNLKEREKETYEKLKRLIDVLVGITVGAITILISPFVSLAIKLDDPGPVFYRQIRIGKNEKKFIVYKFRSMKTNRNEHEETWREKRPNQITRIGRFLRKFHLDEFPQVWSILKGDLSLVGPRPEWVRLGEVFEKEIPFYFQRYLVKPGITGWAQLHFPASLSVEEAKEKFQYDLYYIKNRSFLLDFGIILKTIDFLFRKISL